MAFALLAAPARAQDARFRALVQRGLTAYQAGEWAEARELLEEAHLIRPTAEALRMMGNASFELGEYERAVRYLDQALSFDLRPLTEGGRAEAVRARAAALDHVAVLRIEYFPEVAEVSLDGRVLAASELATLALTPGEYTVSVRAYGYVSEERAVTVTLGEQVESFALLPEGAAESGTSDARYFDENGDVVEPAREPIDPWIWGGIILGVVGAGALAGAGYGIYYAVDDAARNPNEVVPPVPPGSPFGMNVQVLRVGF